MVNDFIDLPMGFIADPIIYGIERSSLAKIELPYLGVISSWN